VPETFDDLTERRRKTRLDLIEAMDRQLVDIFANGVPVVDKQGNPVMDKSGNVLRIPPSAAMFKVAQDRVKQPDEVDESSPIEDMLHKMNLASGKGPSEPIDMDVDEYEH